jgi:hypothetical protein
METIKHRGFNIEVHQDNSPFDPREDDNLGIMVFWHGRYDIGDKHDFTAESFREYMNDHGVVAVLPVYMYDHSGIGFSIGRDGYPFNCPWDSGQVGWIYTTREKVREFLGEKRITAKMKKRVEEILTGEVKAYDQFHSGEVYGYMVKDPDGEDIESCWNFYPDETGGIEYMLEEARSTVDYEIGRRMKRRAQLIKGWIRGKVALEYRQFPDELEFVY